MAKIVADGFAEAARDRAEMKKDITIIKRDIIKINIRLDRLEKLPTIFCELKMLED